MSRIKAVLFDDRLEARAGQSDWLLPPVRGAPSRGLDIVLALVDGR